MRHALLAGLSLLALGAILPEVHGDLLPGRRPGLPPAVQPGRRILPVKVKLEVKVNENAKLPVLQVPINLALGQRPAAGGGAALPAEDEDTDRRAAIGLPTIVAGLALTLAFASGGLWMVRRGSRRSLALLLAVSLFAACTAAVWADIPGPNRRPRPVPAKPGLPSLQLPAGIELTDKLILEPVPNGDHLTLIVPKSMVKEKGEKIGNPRSNPGK
ncbi:MAG TPA: hypothetical protein VN688_08170 [Gemmataceae bacterium]|nr:hypothetical protein [Gemmataceae bacterium]